MTIKTLQNNVWLYSGFGVKEKARVMKNITYRGITLLILVILCGCAGCMLQEQVGPATVDNATPAPSPTPMPVLKNETPARPDYSMARMTVKPETRPARAAFGFSMEYPAGWNITKEHSDDWTAVYNFSSPDGRSIARVSMADEGGSGSHLVPMPAWANLTIAGMTGTYCHDGSGIARDCSPTEPASAYHRPVLVSNDPAVLAGSSEARRLVFASPRDPGYGTRTIYIAYAGKMKGYNFTAPDHYEVAVRVTGPSWDYATGGLRYSIALSATGDQENATVSLFRHMIGSFRIIS